MVRTVKPGGDGAVLWDVFGHRPSVARLQAPWAPEPEPDDVGGADHMWQDDDGIVDLWAPDLSHCGDVAEAEAALAEDTEALLRDWQACRAAAGRR